MTTTLIDHRPDTAAAPPQLAPLVGLSRRRSGGCTCRRPGARKAAAHAHAPDLELDLSPGRHLLRRDDRYLQGPAPGADQAFRYWPGRKSSPSRYPATARANGCCALTPDERGQRHEIETVYIPEEDRGTLCISSQVGCTLTCSFCHTGTQKLVRNLTADEIVGQIMLARDRLEEWPHQIGGQSDAATGGPLHHQCRADGHGRAAL